MRRYSLDRLEKRRKSWECEYFCDRYGYSRIAPQNIDALRALIELRRNEIQWIKRGTNK